jgi:hypothetical protein
MAIKIKKLIDLDKAIPKDQKYFAIVFIIQTNDQF